MDLGCWFANLGGKFDALAFSNRALSLFFCWKIGFGYAFSWFPWFLVKGEIWQMGIGKSYV